MLFRRRKNVIAEFSNLPAAPSFTDVSAIGRLAVDEFLSGKVDRVYLVYTRFYQYGATSSNDQATASPGI